MSENQTNNTKIKREYSILPRKKLLGKVVLLIGSDTSILQSLIDQLAQKGADIALLCWQMSREKAQKIKESVQAAGGHLYLIEQKDYQALNPSHLIERIVANMGHLDIFIDLSAQKVETAAEGAGSEPELRYPDWQFSQAVFEEMLHT